MKTAKEHLKDFPLDYLNEDTRQLVYSAWDNGYANGQKDGYEEGFQTAQIAERGIEKAQKAFDSADLLADIKTICEDYNAKIKKP